MILAAVYCLMIGHPGLVFKAEQKNRESVHSQHELQESEHIRQRRHIRRNTRTVDRGARCTRKTQMLQEDQERELSGGGKQDNCL